MSAKGVNTEHSYSVTWPIIPPVTFLGKPVDYWIDLNAQIEARAPDFNKVLTSALMRAVKAERELAELKQQIKNLLENVRTPT